MEIKKLILDLNGKEPIELTVEEAKELQDILNRTFGVEKEKVYIPYTPYVQPYVIEPYRYWKHVPCIEPYTIYWSNTGSATSLNTGGSY